MKKAFTLIELLIVVAIIAILAAIAVPNFLEAQVRAKVSRVKSDFRSLSTAIQAYRADCNLYPWYDDGVTAKENGAIEYRLWMLTTPVAYVTTMSVKDPFVAQGTPGNYSDALYRTQYNYRSYRSYGWAWNFDCFVLNSLGPDRVKDQGLKVEAMARGLDTSNTPTILYDTTNGTASAGDIPWTGGDTRYQNR